MWGQINAWFPGLRRVLEESGLGIVETPEDMQAESDAAPADPPAPAQAYIPEVGKPPEAGPRMAPPPADETPPAEPFLARVPADRRLPPVDLTESLRLANARLRRERDQAVHSEQRMARQLTAARQLHTDLEHAGLTVAVLVDAAGTRALRLTIPESHGHRDLLFELPPVRLSPLYDLDGSTTSGGGRPSGPIARPADGPDGPVQLGAADRAPGAADRAQGPGVGDGAVRVPGRK